MSKTNTPQQSQFFDAIGKGKIDVVRELVQANRKLLQAYDYSCFGATPLTKICFGDDRSMIAVLIELGVDINRCSDWEMGPWSPLHCAVFTRNDGLANYLLDNGATLDVHAAAGFGRVKDLVRLLDESPGRVAEIGGDGCQPLHFADTVEVAQILLDRGADIESRCVDHYSTPVQYLAGARPEVARFLFSMGAQADIFSAILADDLNVVRNLIAGEPDVMNARINQIFFPPGPEHDVHNIMTFRVGQDSTPMHAAAKANLPSMIELLADSGISPDVRGGYDNGGPLHIAAWDNHLQATESLIRHGADVNLRSGEIHNNSPAGWAIVAGSADVFGLLLDSGAEVLDWFHDDAKKAIEGEFRKHKAVPQENYERIHVRLQEC